MKVQRIVLKNILAVEDFDLLVDGESYFVMGKNGAGKTTTGNIIDLIKRSGNEILRDGKENGHATVILTDGTKIKFQVDKDESTLTIIDGEGDKLPKKSIAGYLNRIMGSPFSLTDFLRMEPAKRRKAVLALVKDTSIDDLFIKKVAAESRKKAAKDIANAAASNLGNVPPNVSTIAAQEVPNVAAINLEIEENEKVLRIVVDMDAKADKLMAEIDSIDAQVAGLQAQIKALFAKKDDAVVNYSQVADRAEMERQKAKDPEYISKLRESISNAVVKAQEISRAKEMLRRMEEVQEAQKNAEKAEEEVKTLTADIAKAISAAKFPVEGLSIDENDILLDGRPFTDTFVSKSRKAIVAAQLSMVGMGELRYLHVEGGELDKTSAMALWEWTKENGLQLSLEKPDWDGGELRYEVINA